MKRKLAYLNKDVTRTDIIALRWFSVDVETSHTKMYHGSLKLYANLTPLARAMLDHILESMDDRNEVVNNKKLKASFKKKFKEKNHADISLNKAFKQIADSSIMEPLDKKGRYRVNPYFFWNGSEKERMKLLREILEEPFTSIIKEQRHERLKKRNEG